MKSLRAAVVGVGYLGRFHAQKLKLVSGVDLVSVHDVDPQRGLAIAQELSIPFENLCENLLRSKLDMIILASSTESHFELARLFLDNGVHVLVEKPMTSTSAQSEELCSLAEKKGCVLQVGHIERFNPAMEDARRMIRTPKFFEARRFSPFKTRSSSIDVVLDMMIHDVDLVLSFARSPVKNIQGTGYALVSEKNDFAQARIEFDSGLVAQFTASRVASETKRELFALEQEQSFLIDLAKGEIVQSFFSPNQSVSSKETRTSEKFDALLREVQSFVSCVREGGTPVVTAQDGWLAVKTCEQILEKINGSGH